MTVTRKPLVAALSDSHDLPRKQAETVLREALRHAPNHPRVLFALSEALAAQGKATEAARLREAFKKAWSPAGGSLTVAAL